MQQLTTDRCFLLQNCGNPNILRKHAEYQPVDEMCDHLGIMAARAEPLSQAGELLRRFFRKRLAGFPGFRRSGSLNAHLRYCRFSGSCRSSSVIS